MQLSMGSLDIRAALSSHGSVKSFFQVEPCRRAVYPKGDAMPDA
jgi:hypothetical protein